MIFMKRHSLDIRDFFIKRICQDQVNDDKLLFYLLQYFVACISMYIHLSHIDNTVRRKILMGKILTNLMNLQQFVNIFPIKIFHLVSYLLLMLEIKLYQWGAFFRKSQYPKLSITLHNYLNSHTLTMTINSFHASVNHHTGIRGNQTMHVPRCDIMCPSPCSCGSPKKVWLIYVYINYN